MYRTLLISIVNVLEEPVNRLTDRLHGDPTHVGASDRTAERYARDRRALTRPGVAHHRIATGAQTGALQQRLMGAISLDVRQTILKALRTNEKRDLRFQGYSIPTGAANDAPLRGAANRLGAAFVQSVFPLWGATTTPDLMRKACLEVDVTVLGGSGQQSARILEAMRKRWTAPQAPRHLIAGHPEVAKTRFIFGNTITALTASQTSVRGPTPNACASTRPTRCGCPFWRRRRGSRWTVAMSGRRPSSPRPTSIPMAR